MSVVYFAKCERMIKIGFSKNLEERLQTLSVASSKPIRLIGTVPGSKKLEQFFHKELHEHRVRGEWFKDCPQVRSFITNPPVMPTVLKKTRDHKANFARPTQIASPLSLYLDDVIDRYSRGEASEIERLAAIQAARERIALLEAD